MFKYFILLAGLFFAKTSFSATADTVIIFSKSMHKNIPCVVIKPDAYKNENQHFPVVYLLHGYAGDYSDWIKKVPSILQYADEFGMMIVCPDGSYSSWYFDSPVDSTMKYETHISTEVPQYIDAHFRTIKNRKARAITGLSMGGHGAFFIAFRHAETFSACGSMSGCMDVNAFKTSYDIIKRLGDTLQHADNYKKYSVINVVDNYPKDSVAIIFDCGVDDGFYGVNKQLHQKLLQMKIPHDYIERPGKHDWNYWSNSIKYQLLFFREYFRKNLIVNS